MRQGATTSMRGLSGAHAGSVMNKQIILSSSYQNPTANHRCGNRLIGRPSRFHGEGGILPEQAQVNSIIR